MPSLKRAFLSLNYPFASVSSPSGHLPSLHWWVRQVMTWMLCCRALVLALHCWLHARQGQYCHLSFQLFSQYKISCQGSQEVFRKDAFLWLLTSFRQPPSAYFQPVCLYYLPFAPAPYLELRLGDWKWWVLVDDKEGWPWVLAHKLDMAYVSCFSNCCEIYLTYKDIYSYTCSLGLTVSFPQGDHMDPTRPGTKVWCLAVQLMAERPFFPSSVLDSSAHSSSSQS